MPDSSHQGAARSPVGRSAASGPLRNRNGSRWATGLLSLLALACGGWALYPALSASPRVPSVSHAALPALNRPAAPEFATTASIQPLISGRLDLNTATQAQLEALPGVGPAFAARLQAARPYRSLSDLDAVPGVGPKLLARLTPLVRF